MPHCKRIDCEVCGGYTLISAIPHKDQRYPTVGDYFKVGNVDHIRVSKMKDPRYEFLVAVHEYIEMNLCKYNGITNESIDNFDLEFEGKRTNASEPGFEPAAPYVKQHTIATAVEMLLCQELGISWKEYSEYVDGL